MPKKKQFKLGDQVLWLDPKSGFEVERVITCIEKDQVSVHLAHTDGKKAEKVNIKYLRAIPKKKKTLKDLPANKTDKKKTENKKSVKKPAIPKTKMVTGKYHFTKIEKEQMAGELARTQMDKREVEDEKKSIMASYKDRLDRFDFDINRLSRNVVNGCEMREFECKIVKDFKAHTKRFIDIHTKKLIDTRPLDPSDYQKEMDI